MPASPRIQPSTNWHLILATLYLSQGFAVMFLMNTQLLFNIDLTFLSHNFLTMEAHTTFRTLFELPLIWLLVATISIPGLLHLYCGSRPDYVRQVVQYGCNISRWLGFGFVYGLVLAVTALLLGVADLGYLLLFMLSGHVFGWLCLLDEYLQHNATKTKLYQKSTVLFKLVAFLKEAVALGPWLLLLGHLLATMLWSNNVLTWTYYLICLLGLLLTGLSLFMVHFFRQGERAVALARFEFWHGSLSFVILSGWLWMIVLQMS